MEELTGRRTRLLAVVDLADMLRGIGELEGDALARRQVGKGRPRHGDPVRHVGVLSPGLYSWTIVVLRGILSSSQVAASSWMLQSEEPGCQAVPASPFASCSLSAANHIGRAHMTITGGAMPIMVFCKTYGIGRSKAYDLINSDAVAARKSSKASPIDRVSAEACYAALPTYRERARIMPPRVSADAQPPVCYTRSHDLGGVAIVRSHARVRWR